MLQQKNGMLLHGFYQRLHEFTLYSFAASSGRDGDEMKSHAQNLSERPNPGKWSIVRDGRVWFYGSGHNCLAHCEWHLLSNHFGLSFNLGHSGDEDLLSFHFGCGLLAIWLILNPRHLHARLLKLFKVEDYEDRQLSVSFHDSAMYWNIWTPSMEWNKQKHGRRQGAFHPVDFLFGRTKYSEVPIREERVEIPMPERSYPATVKLCEAQWRRKRWPLVWTRVRRAEITPDTPIPFPGKGENSWDCGEDATHSMTCQAYSSSEAIGKMVASVMRSRMKYGGENWRPQTKETA